MNGAILTAAVLCAALWSFSSASAASISGPPRLIDGDTLAIAGRVIRLADIDASETRQRCETTQGSYACGEQATDALARIIGNRDVHCAGDTIDRFDRLIAKCSVGDVDINREMVNRGWAVAFRRYSDAYLSEELEAAKSARGMWRGAFQRPVDYRAAQWKVAKQDHPEGCPIKGNISSNGRIYHTPWSRHYTRTRINTARGERWFCSEQDALNAGWRAPTR